MCRTSWSLEGFDKERKGNTVFKCVFLATFTNFYIKCPKNLKKLYDLSDRDIKYT